MTAYQVLMVYRPIDENERGYFKNIGIYYDKPSAKSCQEQFSADETEPGISYEVHPIRLDEYNGFIS